MILSNSFINSLTECAFFYILWNPIICFCNRSCNCCKSITVSTKRNGCSMFLLLIVYTKLLQFSTYGIIISQTLCNPNRNNYPTKKTPSPIRDWLLLWGWGFLKTFLFILRVYIHNCIYAKISIPGLLVGCFN